MKKITLPGSCEVEITETHVSISEYGQHLITLSHSDVEKIANAVSEKRFKSKLTGFVGSIKDKLIIQGQKLTDAKQALEDSYLKKNPNQKIVHWKGGRFLVVPDGITWEYENDEDWDRTEEYKPHLKKN